MTPPPHNTEQLLAQVLAQLVVMIVAARGMNRLFRLFGQPGVVGEIVAGLLLGPSLFSHFAPDAAARLFTPESAPAIKIVAQIGLILLMFRIGSGFEFGRLRNARTKALTLGIALPSIAVPFVLGLLLGGYSQPTLAPAIDPLAYSLFCGVALSITAVPILGRILFERDLAHTEMGVVAIAAATINDVVGWLLLAGVSAYAAATLTGGLVVTRLALLALFLVALRWPLRPLVDRLVARADLSSGELPPELLALTLCLAFLLAICTFELGLFAILGGFAAGTLFHHHRAVVDAWERQVGRLVLVLFLPVFFTYTGLHTNLLGLHGSDWLWLAGVLAAAVLGKIVPVFLGARLAGEATRPAATLAVLMNTRALMELIVLDAGRSLGVIPPTMFTMLVVMAVVTTLITGPLLTLLQGETRRRIATA